MVVSVFIGPLAAVMSSGDRICPEFEGGFQEEVKFHLAVAEDVGIGVRPAAYSANM